jgi:4-aminobutyrate aminotransferase / (S)-3-amino-2-methylpropionate transaminase / 5-aminovalerate transaminase
MTDYTDPRALRDAADRYVLGNLRLPRRIVFTRGSGCRLWDADGNEYLDAVSGTNGVALMGHGHPEVGAALTRQFEQLPSHFFVHDNPQMIELAERISAIAPHSPTKTYLCPGGGEGIDAAIKLALRVTGRTEVLSLHGAYHGTSLAGMGLGGIPMLRDWFPGAARWPHFQQVASPDPYRPSLGEPGDWRPAARSLEATLDFGTFNDVAAVVLELVQGPNGHVALPKEYVTEVRRVCTERGILMIVDEVQTGLARCGAMWACDLYDVVPDIIVIGKAWGGGFPFGGIVVRADLITPEIEASPWHILTFGNQPLQAAAALAVLDIVERDGLVERAAALGERARTRFREMAEQYEVIGDVRGPGLFIGVDLVEDRETRVPATAACAVGNEHAFDIGLLTWFGGAGNVLKFKPPVISTEAEIDAMLDRCEEVIEVIDRSVTESRGRPLMATPPA